MPTVKATFTADISQFRQSLAQASTAVTAFDRTVGQVNTDLKKFGNQFSGATLTRQAETMAKAIADIGGATRLTDAEMKRANATISEAMAKYKALGTEAPASIRSLSQELQKLNTESAKVGTSLTGASRGLGGLLTGIAAGAGFAVFTAALGQLKGLASEATAFTPLQQSFEKLQGGALQAESALLGLRVATKGLVSDTDLLRAANKGSLLGLGDMGIKFDEVARVATVLGRAMGQDAAKSVDDLTTALSRMSPQILDNLGIKVDLTKATADYAKANHKSVESLTEEEKKLAFATAAMDAARTKAKALGDAQLTVWENTQKITTALSDMVVQVISAGNESQGFAAALGKVADALDRLRNTGPAAIRAIKTEMDLALKLGVQGAGGGTPMGAAMFGGGPFGALISAYMNMRMGPMQAADIGTFGGAARGRDITLPGAVTPATVAPAAVEKAEKTTKKLTDLQRELNAETQKAFKFAHDAARGWEEYEGNLQLARMEMEAFIAMQPDNLIGAKHPMSAILSGPYQYQISDNMTGGVLDGTKKVAVATKDWRVQLQGVAQAFAQLAQVGGPALQRINQSLGTVFAAANAGQQMVSALAEMVGGLTTTKDGKTVPTTAGKALGGGLAGLSAGMSVGSLFTNRGKGALAGAASGAAAGGMAGGWVGAGVGALVGAFAGMFASAANAAAQRVAKDVQAGQLTAEFGGLDKLLDVVGGLGMSQGGFLKAFYGEPKAFAQAVTQLNQALAKERQEADKLAKSLAEVARVQGVLSRQQLTAMTHIRPGGPGSEEVVAFAAQQRDQAEAGITQAIAALDTLTAGGTQNLDQFDASVGAVTASLVVLFDQAVKSGESAVTVLKRLAAPIQQLQALMAAGGMTPGAGFGNLQALSDIAGGAQTGPLVEMAQGLGSALAGLANTGLLSPELFAELANGIGEAYKQLENLGKGGLEAARLMQPSLQALWQMLQDNPELAAGLDESTKALLDFAESSGLIGDKFRPAIDQMIASLNDLIAKIGELIDTMADVPALPGGSSSGQPFGGQDPPAMAAGGVVTRPTVALVGEAGPEAIIPLAKLGGMRGPSEQTINIMLDGRLIANSVVRELPRVVRVYTGAA